MNHAPALPYTDIVDDGLADFQKVRRRLFGIAYRMLGSVAEAEDVVQDVWLRWQATDRSQVRDPGAFLATATTRLAITLAQSARMRRESYVGPWLPEPVDTSADPALGAERADALGFAILLLLEKLTPNERAAYVLREAFDYPYPHVAEILDTSEANARQLVRRGRQHLAGPRRAPVSADQQKRLLRAFVDAAQAGELAVLESLLAADVVSTSDGGGVARAAAVPVVGRERVARFVKSFAGHFWTGVTLTWIEANGQPALCLSRDGAVTTVLTIEASTDGIEQILWMMNPGKLRAVSA